MHKLKYSTVLVIGLLLTISHAYAQNYNDQPPTETSTKTAEPAPSVDDKKNQSTAEGETKSPTPVQPTPTPSSAGKSVVDSQRGCRIQIKGMSNANKNSIIQIKDANGGIIDAKFLAIAKNFTIANVSNENCKRNLKGLMAELIQDPETLPLQTTSTTVHQPQSSGWHRTKRSGAWTFGLGAGLRMQVPVYRIELGQSWSNLSAVSALEYGQGGDSSLKLGFLTVSGELQLHVGNSLYLSGGWCSETAGGSFIPVNSFDGKIKKTPDFSAAYKTSSTKIHYGVGNRWQWGGLSLGVEWIGFRGILSKEDEVVITNFTTDTVGDGVLALNKNYIAENTPADYRFFMTRLLYSF